MNDFVMPVLPTPLEERLERRRVTTIMQIPKREFLFMMHNTPCFPKGELVGITGKAKSGKTFFTSILMAASLIGETMTVKRNGEKQLKVAWFDTEQSEESTQEILLNRVYPLAGNCPEIDDYIEVFNLRPESWQNRLPLIETAVRAIQPDLVILDGIRDVVADINDGVMASTTVQRVLQLAGETGACIVCALHQNKAPEDNSLRGALGTEMQNKCFECYECKKDMNTLLFSVKQTLTRKYDIRDELYYSVGANGLPKNSAKPAAPAENTSLPQQYTSPDGRVLLHTLFRDCLPETGYATYQQMEEKFYQRTGTYSCRLFNSLRQEAIDQGVIVRSNTVPVRYSMKNETNSAHM